MSCFTILGSSSAQARFSRSAVTSNQQPRPEETPASGERCEEPATAEHRPGHHRVWTEPVPGAVLWSRELRWSRPDNPVTGGRQVLGGPHPTIKTAFTTLGVNGGVVENELRLYQTRN